MKAHRIGIVLLATAMAAALAFPIAASAGPLIVERSIRGALPDGTVLSVPDISADWLVYEVAASGSFHGLYSYYLGGGTSWQWTGAAADVENPSVSGDWVVWGVGDAVMARNVKSATAKTLTNDGAGIWNGLAKVSAADGAFAVWSRLSGGEYDVMAKDLGTTHAAYVLAGGVGRQIRPAVHGKHVVYSSDVSGVYNVYFKTIGSSAAAVRIAPSARDQYEPDIGNHLAVWLEPNDSGKLRIRYYDFNTGLVSDGPSYVGQHIGSPQVSGDRIIYSVSNGADQDLYVFDTLLARSYLIAGTNLNDMSGRIDGDQLTYVSGSMVYYARLQVPSISLKSVPKRIRNHGHIHVAGSISDQGHRIAWASLRIDKFSSGKWVAVKTITASAAGTFSYKTPKIHSKTKYRVVYTGFDVGTTGDYQRHLSAVSSVKTAWPRR